MNRCNECKKKSLVTFNCECKKNFCAYHRLPENHKCEKMYDVQRHSFKINEKNVMYVKTDQFVRLE